MSLENTYNLACFSAQWIERNPTDGAVCFDVLETSFPRRQPFVGENSNGWDCRNDESAHSEPR